MPPQQSGRPVPRRPPRWPNTLEYLTEPKYHSSVPPQLRDVLVPRVIDPTRIHAAPQKPLVAIQSITEPSHPARGQFGLFAAKKIPPRTFILDYIGEIHCDNRPNSDYDLSLYRSPDHVSVGIDAQFAGDEARFINDYRGVRPKPNALFQERRTDTGELRMSVWSGSEPIKKGDELLVSYGKSWWKERLKAEGTTPAEDPALAQSSAV